MAKILISCKDPNDLDELYRRIDDAAGRCNITYFKQHEKMIEAGKSKSVRETARKISAETGESFNSVHHRIRRGQEEVCHLGTGGKKQSGGRKQALSKRQKSYSSMAALLTDRILEDLETIKSDKKLTKVEREEAFDRVVEWIRKNRR